MKLDLHSQMPIYLQIAEMIREAIVKGDIKASDSIPSVRQMSVEYGINPQTILKATSLLLQENILEKKRGLGLFVTDSAQEKLMLIEMKKYKNEFIPFLINRGNILGFTSNDICEIIKSAGVGDP